MFVMRGSTTICTYKSTNKTTKEIFTACTNTGKHIGITKLVLYGEVKCSVFHKEQERFHCICKVGCFLLGATSYRHQPFGVPFLGIISIAMNNACTHTHTHTHLDINTFIHMHI